LGFFEFPGNTCFVFDFNPKIFNSRRRLGRYRRRGGWPDY